MRWAFVCLIAAGCASGPTGSSAELGERPDQPGATRASREAESIAMPSPSHRLALIVHEIAAERGEDGRGATLAATRALAFDLDASGFPPRALDPVLWIGELRFVHYQHPRPGILRFVVADRALLSAGAPVALQYGTELRTIVAASWEAP